MPITGHPIYVSKDVRIPGYFLKHKRGPRAEKFGNVGIDISYIHTHVWSSSSVWCEVLNSGHFYTHAGYM